GRAVVVVDEPLVPVSVRVLELEPADDLEALPEGLALRLEPERRRVLDEVRDLPEVLERVAGVLVVARERRVAVLADRRDRGVGHEADGRAAVGTLELDHRGARVTDDSALALATG